MLSKVIVFVVVGAIFALCQASDAQKLVDPMSIFSRKGDFNKIFVSSRGRSIDPANKTNEATISDGDNGDAANSNESKPPRINDTDYWDNDDFQPYKNDNRDFFDWRLLEAVFTTSKSNVIVSPFSLKFVLALLNEAADGESATKRELSSIFNGASLPFLGRDTYQEMLNSLKESSSKYKLNFGTKMFISSHITPRPVYQNILKDKYDTEIQPLDFSQSNDAANTINKWCSNVTEGHLNNLVNSDNIQNSVLLLINAIYFDGKWRQPFTESFESVFFRQPSEQIRTEYMTVTDKFYFSHSTMWNAKVLRLPYQGKKFSMTIILPGAKGGLEELIRIVDGDALRRVQWLMTEQKVKVTLPKFKFDFTAQLKETLMSLGINEIFSDSAALSGIARGSSLVRKMKVTEIIQKAGIEVHETGTTAFAATDVEIVNKFGGDNYEEFIVNRPFIFTIMDEGTSNMIFAGKVLDPTV